MGNGILKQIIPLLILLFLGYVKAFAQFSTVQSKPEKPVPMRQNPDFHPYPGSGGLQTAYQHAPFRLRSDIPGIRSFPYKSDAELPSKYDLRDVGLVTAAKYQGNGSAGGNCASFAVIGSIESSWLKMTYSENDLSEQNLSGCHGYEWAYGTGSNPNPGRDIFNIIAEGVQSTSADIILFNLNGKALQRKTIANQGGMISTRMDLSMYASGIYQLLLIDGKQVANQRIIKQ